MLTNRKLLLASGSVLLTVLGTSSVKADTTLHMDINSITISAFDSTGTTPTAFTGTGFTGQLQFGVNSNSVISTDINDDPNDGFTGNITGFTGSLSLAAGALTGGSVTVTVQNGAATDTYSYNVLADTGSLARSPDASVFNQLGYGLAGDTNNGVFANNNFGGIDVSPWVANEPLTGNFFQFHYRPNGLGTDQGGDVELYVDTIPGAKGAPAVGLPMASYGGVMCFAALALMQRARTRRMSTPV